MTREARTGQVGGVAGEQLLSVIQRVERLNEEKKALNADISDIFKESRANGFDVAVIKQIIKMRSTDKETLEERETILDVYLSAIGGLDAGDVRQAAE